jgi:hypothetical protein
MMKKLEWRPLKKIPTAGPEAFTEGAPSGLA